MNSVIESMLARRSCRSFSGEPIPREKLQKIVEVALNAPSARNRQLWQFTVVADQELLEKLRAAVALYHERGDEYNFYRPAAMILCSNQRDYAFGREDCACAMENMLLAAHALELGAVWINQLTSTCDFHEVRAVLSCLGVPEDHVVYGCAAIGVPAQAPAAKEILGKVVWH